MESDLRFGHFAAMSTMPVSVICHARAPSVTHTAPLPRKGALLSTEWQGADLGPDVERGRESARERESERERASERERERETWGPTSRESECVCVCVRERERDCVCVRERERERERETEREFLDSLPDFLRLRIPKSEPSTVPNPQLTNPETWSTDA